ncbi:hypothetical protein D3C81_2148850 [compost metagenome]
MFDFGQGAGDDPWVAVVVAKRLQCGVGAAYMVPGYARAKGFALPGFEQSGEIDELQQRRVLVVLRALLLPIVAQTDPQ